MNQTMKFYFFEGLSNGYLLGSSFGRADSPGERKFQDCLMKGLHATQAVAMIDKYYRDHPERWSAWISTEIVAALAVPGGPCR